jgi:hypothetical protein
MWFRLQIKTAPTATGVEKNFKVLRKLSDFCEIARCLVTIFPSCEDVHKAKKLSVNIFPIFQKLRKCVFFKTKNTAICKSTLYGKMFLKTSVEDLHHLHAAPFPGTIFDASSALDSSLLYIYFNPNPHCFIAITKAAASG